MLVCRGCQARAEPALEPKDRAAGERAGSVQGPPGRLRGGGRGHRGGLSATGPEVPSRRVARSGVAGADGPDQPGVGDAPRRDEARRRRPRPDPDHGDLRDGGGCRRARPGLGGHPATPPGTTYDPGNHYRPQASQRPSPTAERPPQAGPATATPSAARTRPAVRRRRTGRPAAPTPAAGSTRRPWPRGRASARGSAAGQPVGQRAQRSAATRLVARRDRPPRPRVPRVARPDADRAHLPGRDRRPPALARAAGRARRPAPDKSRGLFRRR